MGKIVRSVDASGNGLGSQTGCSADNIGLGYFFGGIVKFVKNWLDVIVAVTFLTGIVAFWAVTSSEVGTEVAVSATAYEPVAVESTRSPASDGSEVTDDDAADENADATQNTQGTEVTTDSETTAAPTTK